jgi:hypothetical protein
VGALYSNKLLFAKIYFKLHYFALGAASREYAQSLLALLRSKKIKLELNQALTEPHGVIGPAYRLNQWNSNIFNIPHLYLPRVVL